MSNTVSTDMILSAWILVAFLLVVLVKVASNFIADRREKREQDARLSAALARVGVPAQDVERVKRRLMFR